MNAYQHAAYLDILRPHRFTQILRDAVRKIRASKLEFDSIAFTGMSGTLLSPSLAHRLRKEMVMVRKEQDKNNHSGRKVEGFASVKRFIIVDEQVSSGATAHFIVKQIHEEFSDIAQCVGVYEYYDGRFTDNNDYRVKGIFKSASSVPKIEATDDPTVVKGSPFTCGCDWATTQSCSKCKDSLTLSDRLSTVAELISVCVDSEAPAEPESEDLSF